MKYLVLGWDPDYERWDLLWWRTNLRDARRELRKVDGPTVKLVRVETLEDINYS